MFDVYWIKVHRALRLFNSKRNIEFNCDIWCKIFENCRPKSLIQTFCVSPNLCRAVKCELPHANVNNYFIVKCIAFLTNQNYGGMQLILKRWYILYNFFLEGNLFPWTCFTEYKRQENKDYQVNGKDFGPVTAVIGKAARSKTRDTAKRNLDYRQPTLFRFIAFGRPADIFQIISSF